MKILSEYDIRQLRLIEKILKSFDLEKGDLFALVNNLRVILNSLEIVNSLWGDNFEAEVNTLEMIQDSINDGSISRWKESPGKVKNKSILELKKMTSILINDYLKLSNSKITEIAIVAEGNWLICSKCSDAWESTSKNAMIICPSCESIMHNPLHQGEPGV